MSVTREVLGFPGKVGGAAAGSLDVEKVLENHIGDYKNVLDSLKPGSNGPFNHEVNRLGGLLKELENLYARHVKSKGLFQRVAKGVNRMSLHEDILRQIRTIDEEAIRQFTAVAAKSAICGLQTTGGSSSSPAPAGDFEIDGVGVGDTEREGKSERVQRPGEGNPAYIYPVSTWSGRQRTVCVGVCEGRWALNSALNRCAVNFCLMMITEYHTRVHVFMPINLPHRTTTPTLS